MSLGPTRVVFAENQETDAPLKRGEVRRQMYAASGGAEPSFRPLFGGADTGADAGVDAGIEPQKSTFQFVGVANWFPKFQ